MLGSIGGEKGGSGVEGLPKVEGGVMGQMVIGALILAVGLFVGFLGGVEATVRQMQRRKNGTFSVE